MAILADEAIIFQFFHDAIRLLTPQISKVPDVRVAERTVLEKEKGCGL